MVSIKPPRRHVSIRLLISLSLALLTFVLYTVSFSFVFFHGDAPQASSPLSLGMGQQQHQLLAASSTTAAASSTFPLVMGDDSSLIPVNLLENNFLLDTANATAIVTKLPAVNSFVRLNGTNG
jgi:hypothetical protein